MNNEDVVKATNSTELLSVNSASVEETLARIEQLARQIAAAEIDLNGCAYHLITALPKAA